jgi:tetratricopeptide (TPR) repeat protein
VPEHPRLAYSVGRLARDRGEYARAESWLRTSIRLARGIDWHTYALAYLSLGTLYQQLGNLPAARSVTLRGYRTSVRRRVRPLQGVALHNLFTIATEMLDFERAQQFALAASLRYGPNHPRFPMLVHDVGCFWMFHGCFERAADVFELVLPRLAAPENRVLTLGTLARAAAAAGRTAVYRSSFAEAESLLGLEVGVPERAAQVWLDLARAAASAGDYAQAEAAAQRAVEVAAPLRLGQIRMEVEVVLASVRAARTAGASHVASAAAPAFGAPAEQVAEEIVQVVRAAVVA